MGGGGVHKIGEIHLKILPPHEVRAIKDHNEVKKARRESKIINDYV